MKHGFIVLLICISSLQSKAQVRHNFEKGPENTNCHTLSDHYDDIEDYVVAIKRRTYRFTHQLKISSYRSPRQLEYFSCDGSEGFVIAQIDTSTHAVHTSVTKAAWEELLNSTDVLEFYSNTFLVRYPHWKPSPE